MSSLRASSYVQCVLVIFTPFPTLQRTIPTSLLNPRCVLFLKPSEQVYVIEYYWMCGFPLEHSQHLRGVTPRENEILLFLKLPISNISSA